MGSAWAAFTRSFDPRLHKLTGANYGDHYLLTINSIGNTSQAIQPVLWSTRGVAGSLSTDVTNGTLCIYIPTRSLSFFTNPPLQGIS